MGLKLVHFVKKFNKPYIKSINVSNISNHENFLRNYESAEQILLDSGTEQLSGGTGEKFDWNQIPTNFNNLIIAGGLNPNNILRLLDYFIPFGVDVCSGVESKKGVKDTTKMKNFIDFVNVVNYTVSMSDLNKNTHNQITEQDIKEHRSRGIYLRDDHCDWGSSGMEDISTEDSNQSKNS